MRCGTDADRTSTRETATWTGTERWCGRSSEMERVDGRERGGGVASDTRLGWWRGRGEEKTTREKEVNGNEKKRERTRDRRRATVVVFGLAGTTIQKTLVERTPRVARHRRSGVVVVGVVVARRRWWWRSANVVGGACASPRDRCAAHHRRTYRAPFVATAATASRPRCRHLLPRHPSDPRP